VQDSDLTREVCLSDRVAKVVGIADNRTASLSNFAAAKPADKGCVLAMQEEQSKSTVIHKYYFIRSTAGRTGMTAWSLA